MQYLRVMNGSTSHTSGYTFELGKVNTAPFWHPKALTSEEQGGFNFSNEENILRWMIRGDTLYDVTIPDSAEVIKVNNESTPEGVYRTNKIIVTNPRVITDEMTMALYQKSKMPERAYFKTLAAMAIRGCENTALAIIQDKINQNNIDLAIEDYESFRKILKAHPEANVLLYNQISEDLQEIKSPDLISIVGDKKPLIKKLTDDQVINLTGQSGAGKSYYAQKYLNNSNYLVIDTDDVFSAERFAKATGINKELGTYLRNNYAKSPDLYNDFDLIYQVILNYCHDKGKIIVIDSAQFHCIKDIKLLKGTVIVMRTSIKTCYERCLNRYQETHPHCTALELQKYRERKKNIYKWYKDSNEFIKKINNNF
jgi:adenylate kinase family enzyme